MNKDFNQTKLLSFSEEKQLKVVWLFKTLCEQLSPEAYQKYRPLARDMMQLLNEEIVLSPLPKVKKQ